MRAWPAIFLLSLLPREASACDLALVLAVDVSGSVDAEEYGTQMQGLAAGLRDGVVADALVQGRSALALVQWTGSSRQELSIPWVRIESHADVEALAARILDTPRAWRNFSTAIGEALRFSQPLFDEVPGCSRRVIDLSGDGASNEGIEPADVGGALAGADITVNALVIEGAEFDLTGYFWENVITGEGAFVVTANGYAEYPERMRQKLLRETTKQLTESRADRQVIPASGP